MLLFWIAVVVLVILIVLNRQTFLELVLHPNEAFLIVKFLLFNKKQKAPAGSTEAQKYCYDTLVKVSRSFAAVIMELPVELRDAVMVFYLVLRALDSIEDDMAIELDKKREMLIEFYDKTEKPKWSLTGYGEKPTERDLLEHYYHVSEVFMNLKPEYRNVIKEICKRMGAGMAEFTTRQVVTVSDYELYCHYVAGLVGIGLSRLFGHSGLEAAAFAHPTLEPLANAMGLFLQKTNITRDYREDVDQQPPRIFYPRDIWSKYASDFGAFREKSNERIGVQLVNEMVADAMRHAPASIDYLSRLRQPDVFRFCAIPQVMAIATLERCYANAQVLGGVVKIRKGEALSLIDECHDFQGCLRAFARYTDMLEARAKGDSKMMPQIAALKTSIQNFKQ